MFSKKDRVDVKTNTIIALSVVSFVAGTVLCYIAVLVDPIGEIHHSVLTALGEFLTFSGALLGIGVYAKKQIDQIRNYANKKLNEIDEYEKTDKQI